MDQKRVAPDFLSFVRRMRQALVRGQYALPVFCLGLFGGGCDPTVLSGSFALHDATGAGWQLRPTLCLNGDTREFYGVDLIDGSADLRLFQDPLWGWSIAIAPDGNTAMPSDLIGLNSGCQRFDPELTYDPCGRCGKNDTDEDDSTMSGHLELDCPLTSGGRISGRVDFQFCNNPEEQ